MEGQLYGGNVPEWFLAGYPMIGMLIGDIVKATKIPSVWLLVINGVVGGMLGIYALEMDHVLAEFMSGVGVGLGATGLHRLVKTVSPTRS